MDNRHQWSKFFPKKVYRFPCLGEIIEKCFLEDFKTFLQIHDEVFTYVLKEGIHRVFTPKCSEKLEDLILSCEEHSGIMVFAHKKFDCTAEPSFETLRLQLDDEDPEKTFCKYCVKKYLRKSISYFYYLKFN